METPNEEGFKEQTKTEIGNVAQDIVLLKALMNGFKKSDPKDFVESFDQNF